jgi:Protein of unknown function (DUF2889)
MPLSSAVPRQSLHHRAISAMGYKRVDGLYEVEVTLRDTKDIPIALFSGQRAAGEPIHEMWLRITYDTSLTIRDAEAATDAMPYVGICHTVAPKYRELVGLSMRPGFTERVRELFGGVRGCTHLTDMIAVAATTAFQNLAGQVHQDATKKPYQLDRCHALRTDGLAVAKFYPQWVTGRHPE